MRTLTESDAGNTVELKLGETIELVLPENPTAGFRWHVDRIDTTACTVLSDVFRPPAEATPGAGGVHVWKLKALRVAAECPVALSYRRAWEIGAPAKTFTSTLRIFA
ncbi:MAG TPA: protease inhibitor I42 family protein [Pseudolabrys sp.]|jgi:inhibitor of cysteine peptidase|nr:protease inhibitor I42 family protein [Pseudolabrys sp.]